MQAKLIIRDEVNVKIEGLDLSDRTALVKKFKYEIPGARYQPSVRLGRWDGKVAFFQLGGSGYINLLPEILPYLESKNYDVDVEDLELGHLIDQGFRLARRQLSWVASTRTRQAVHAGQIAGVGQLPRQTDWGFES